MSTHYLYIITNQINNKVYIGQTIDPRDRWYKHTRLALSKPKVQVITAAIAKYGAINFTFDIIATCITQDDADHTEIELIKQYNSLSRNGFGYNVSIGGNIPNLPHSAQARQKMCDNNKSKRTLTVEQENEVVALYLSGLSTTQISAQLKRPDTLIWRTLKRYKVAMRQPCEYHNTKTKGQGRKPPNFAKYKLSDDEIAIVKTMTYQQAHDAYGLSPRTIYKYKNIINFT